MGREAGTFQYVNHSNPVKHFTPVKGNENHNRCRRTAQLHEGSPGHTSDRKGGRVGP